jgi:hypothetical protein
MKVKRNQHQIQSGSRAGNNNQIRRRREKLEGKRGNGLRGEEMQGADGEKSKNSKIIGDAK